MMADPQALVPEEVKLYLPKESGVCVHEAFEPDPGWCVLSVPSRGVYVRVCKKCRVLYADLALPSTEISNQ